MGSGSSRMVSRSPPRSDHRSRINFSTFLCGGASTSASSPQVEEQPSEKLVLPATILDSMTDHDLLHNTIKETPLTFSSESSSSVSVNEHLQSNQSINRCAKECSGPPQSANTSDSGKCFTERKMLPYLSASCSDVDRSSLNSTCDLASTSLKPDHLEPSLTNIDSTLVPVAEAADFLHYSAPQPSPVRFSSDISLLESGNSSANGISTAEIHVSDSTPQSLMSISSSTSNLTGEGSLAEATSSAGPDLLTVEERRNANVLHVDVVSISSNILPSGARDLSSNDTRRNNRRLFWDAFSRHSSRRHYDTRALLTSSGDNDDLLSHDRWLLDISDELFGSSSGNDSLYFRRRRHGSNGRWHSRSEARERLNAGFDNGRSDTPCPSGLHLDGACPCDSLFMIEESSARSSISRIVLLAEALFEVLDEIHRQSDSLAMVSLPAPESVVNSLPVKTYNKDERTLPADDAEQCYICLAEYEEGDKIRVLPCRHEYHMLCVDKWLKEIHGICPLCRGDICEIDAENSADAAP